MTQSHASQVWRPTSDVYDPGKCWPCRTLGCMATIMSEREILGGDPEFFDAHWLNQVWNKSEIWMHKLAWIFLTKSITDEVVVLSRAFKTRSPSAGWKMLVVWFMPKPLGELEKWNNRFNNFISTNMRRQCQRLLAWMRLHQYCSL